MTETADPAAVPPDGADPSMEDILASIRRILNEEEAPAAPRPMRPPPDDEVGCWTDHDGVLRAEIAHDG